MIDKKRLQLKLQAYNINLLPDVLEKLGEYATLLVDWNNKINLTSITQPEGIEDKHFIDSLLFAAQPEVQGSLVDVGSGAGFPGLVAALYNSRLDVTLMEPTGKRVTFLESAANELGVRCTVVKERAEEAARKQWREKYDIAVARAVASLPQLCEYCLPLVKPGGLFIAMKGPDADTEIAASARALQLLGGVIDSTVRFELPDGSVRILVKVKKVGVTPDVYPRNGGKIAKKPL